MGKNLRDFKNSSERVNFLEKELGIKLSRVTDYSFSEEQVLNKNVENLVGATHVPLGVAGPIKIQDSRFMIQDYFIPIATSEGALVASVSRGCKAISLSGGATALVEIVGMTRGPVFKTRGILHSREIRDWVEKNFSKLSKVASTTSAHLKLIKADFSFSGKSLFIRFYFDTSFAMGMNMVTIASEEMAKAIEKETKCECISISGNFDVDKKSSWLNFINGRGRKVWGEAIIKRQVVREVLKTSVQEIVDVTYRKNLVGSALSGSMGQNAHYANILAGIFIATGQDVAQIVESSLGITSAEVLDTGDLYFSVYLPSLEIGVLGGGTSLPTQKEALSILKVKDTDNFAEVIVGAVLAGELSLIASLAEGSLVRAHKKLGRGKKS